MPATGVGDHRMFQAHGVRMRRALRPYLRVASALSSCSHVASMCGHNGGAAEGVERREQGGRERPSIRRGTSVTHMSCRAVAGPAGYGTQRA